MTSPYSPRISIASDTPKAPILSFWCAFRGLGGLKAFGFRLGLRGEYLGFSV